MAATALLGKSKTVIFQVNAASQIPETLYNRLFQTTCSRLYRIRKPKEKKPPRLVQLIQAGASQEEVDKFVNTRAERRAATADYKAKIAEVAGIFREELRIEEEKRKDVAGELMKKEAEEKLQEAKNWAIILENNEELRKERELRNLIAEERRLKEEEAELAKQKEKEDEIYEKRRQKVLKTIEESKNFVTKENLEEKIAFALDNVVNYNFAITPDGEKLYSTKPPGNFDQHGYKGPSPAAFQLGGINHGEWDFVFQKQYKTSKEKTQTTNEDERTES